MVDDCCDDEYDNVGRLWWWMRMMSWCPSSGMVDEAKSPIPPGPAVGNKLDQLSKEDLVKFAKKQVANLAEMKKNQGSLMEKLKIKMAEVEKLKVANEKLSEKTECSECLGKLEIEKELRDLKEKTISADMLSLELRDSESKIDNLNRALREKTEALIRAHEVIAESDARIAELQKAAVDVRKIEEDKQRVAERFENEKKQRMDVEARLRSAECRIHELSDQQGSEKMGLARKMAESENRAGLLEEAIEMLKEENTKLTKKSENSLSKLEQIEKEYTEFKNKARFVLENNKKNVQNSESAEIVEELEKSKKNVENLEAEMAELKTDMSKNLEILTNTRDQNERLVKELDAVKRDLEQSESGHLKAMDDLRLTFTKTVQRLEEDLRNCRTSKDSLDAKLKETEIQKEKAEHLLKTERRRAESELSSMSLKLEASKKQQKALEIRVEELTLVEKSATTIPKAIAAVQPITTFSPGVALSGGFHSHVQQEKETLTINDSVSCYNDEITQPDRSLEDVLYGDIEEEYKTDNFELSEERFSRLCEELENMKKTNSHIGELLSEAESANGRLVSQNALLKEEIRRLERKEERAEELSNEQNMEYLKNVVVQFFKSTTSPAERAQLLIVIQRVLHLSPQETEVLKISGDVLSSQASSNSSSWFNWS